MSKTKAVEIKFNPVRVDAASLRVTKLYEKDGISSDWILNKGISYGFANIAVGDYNASFVISPRIDNIFHCNCDYFYAKAADREACMATIAYGMEATKALKHTFWTGTPERKEFMEEFAAKYPNIPFTTTDKVSYPK